MINCWTGEILNNYLEDFGPRVPSQTLVTTALNFVGESIGSSEQ
jgi:hypothetical protein